MELWIRSQDREQLRKIVDFKYQKGTLENNDIDVIVGTTQYDEWDILGTYQTKERALEVLDNIEKWFVKTNVNNYQVIIYEMPEE